MIELLRMHPMGDNPRKATPVYIVTRNGSDYTNKGLCYVEDEIKDQFQEENELVAYTGPGLNYLKVLKAQLEKHPDAYCVLSYDKGIMFFPKECNQQIVDNLIKVYAQNPKENSWAILMMMINQEPY